MNRKEFLKSSSLLVAGSMFGSPKIPTFPANCNPFFWQLLKKFGEALLIDLAVDYTKPLIKNLFSSNEHKSLEEKGYKYYEQVPIYTNSNHSLFAYTMIKESKKGDIISSQSPFVVNNAKKFDTVERFNELEIAAISFVSGELTSGSNINEDEKVRKILVPKLITGIGLITQENPTKIFNTENGKVSISITKNNESKYEAEVEIYPNRLNNGSNDILFKEHYFKFNIETS